MRPRRLPLASLAPLVAAACATDPAPMPLCLAETVQSNTLEVQERQLEPAGWFHVLLYQWNRDTGRLERPARDCMRREIKWELTETCPGAPLAEALPDRPLIAEDIVISNVDDKHDLVWVITTRHVDGTGTGPVALVEWVDRGVAVRAMGPLHAPTEAARLRLEPLGTEDDDNELLVVEAELCSPAYPDPYTLMHPPEGADGAGAPPAATTPPEQPRCQPTTTLLPILEGQVRPTPLTTPDGECLGESFFYNLDAIEVDLPEGWVRRFDLATETRFEGGNIVVREQVRVMDSDPNSPALPPRPFRTVDDERAIALVNGHLETERVALFERVLARDARVDGEPIPASERRKVALPEPPAKAPNEAEHGGAPAEGGEEKPGGAGGGDGGGEGPSTAAPTKPESPELKAPEAPTPGG